MIVAGAYDPIYANALRNLSEWEARLEAYGDDGGRNTVGVKCAKKICDLIALFEEHETDFLEVIDDKKARVLTARAEADKKNKGAKKPGQ